jgi:hypothetical protein
MIMHYPLHLHEGQAMTMPLMTHQLGALIGDGIDLHLGQKPKLGGGTPMIHSSINNILSVLCISMFHFLFFDCSCSYFYFPKHKKFQKYFALFAVSFRSCFKIQKPKNICCSSLVL